MSATRPSVYVASPLGFDAAGRAWYASTLLPAVAAAGFEALDPWSAEPAAAFVSAGSDVEALRRLNARAGAANAEMIARADGLLAVLDGVDVDSGTASEIGFASARGIPIVGLRTDLRMAGDNPAAVVNLQVQHFVERTGGAVVGDLGDALSRLDELLAAR